MYVWHLWIAYTSFCQSPGCCIGHVEQTCLGLRCGCVCEGNAVTFCTDKDMGLVGPVANVVKEANGDVPNWMLALKKDKRHKKALL